MKANEIREEFLSFFRSKEHKIVPSAPMVIKNDPTLMFTNAGMNQFKDIFLGNQPATYKRIADSQKCLRVSGKHNDLEEVGNDTYHHTMFEMLGNWSFGDYFKKEAIEWAWEFLSVRMGITQDRIYATVFEGDPAEGVPRDDEAATHWERCFSGAANHILDGSKKDNFWEMGETGPCGPCSEIHVDIRNDDERAAVPGHTLVNKGHPLVIEIWNLVFIQYNRRAGGELEMLPEKHIDTGMGFERLCMVMQKKESNYDTDIFQPIIAATAAVTGKTYGKNREWDIAHRVIADHLRTVAFSVADGQLPSNNRAGYVIRRILRRAVRYGYTTLGMSEPFIYKLLPSLIDSMGNHYPELIAQQEIISRVIFEEEQSFLKTLGKGLKMIERKVEVLRKEGRDIFPGGDAFELFDTYGFPLDLTQLILRENSMTLDEEEFTRELNAQKDRSRDDASIEAGDWVVIHDVDSTLFTGYERTEETVRIARYRKVLTRGREAVHLVFDKTPFYAESGGQTGDKGYITAGGEKIMISDTVKENNLIIHISDKVPADPSILFTAVVNADERQNTANNHTATHLMHHALREILGKHVEQRGSLVTAKRLRFDFSHFRQVTQEELAAVEEKVNEMIMKNIISALRDDTPMEEALAMGAIALFGEKYGERVRVVSFGDSVELCGGTHVESTSRIGLFKIVSEGAVAAGIRRIEAVTGRQALAYVNDKLKTLDEITTMLRSTGNPTANISRLMAENASLKNSLGKMQQAAASVARNELTTGAVPAGNCRIYSGVLANTPADTLKNIAHQIRQSDTESIIIIGSDDEGKAFLVVGLGDEAAATSHLNAVEVIKTVASEISGGGGGQPFLATAGGKRPEGLPAAIEKAVALAKKIISNRE
ncbi:MAG: alanine--tRNA ligase [Bacteroidales bacterium]|jgi:alanyl-tRNA synthetase|nr:alanine--tRNA ligase [Bacteroidales bacterium]